MPMVSVWRVPSVIGQLIPLLVREPKILCTCMATAAVTSKFSETPQMATVPPLNPLCPTLNRFFFFSTHSFSVPSTASINSTYELPEEINHTCEEYIGIK